MQKTISTALITELYKGFPWMLWGLCHFSNLPSLMDKNNLSNMSDPKGKIDKQTYGDDLKSIAAITKIIIWFILLTKY